MFKTILHVSFQFKLKAIVIGQIYISKPKPTSHLNLFCLLLPLFKLLYPSIKEKKGELILFYSIKFYLSLLKKKKNTSFLISHFRHRLPRPKETCLDHRLTCLDHEATYLGLSLLFMLSRIGSKFLIHVLDVTPFCFFLRMLSSFVSPTPCSWSLPSLQLL